MGVCSRKFGPVKFQAFQPLSILWWSRLGLRGASDMRDLFAQFGSLLSLFILRCRTNQSSIPVGPAASPQPWTDKASESECMTVWWRDLYSDHLNPPCSVSPQDILIRKAVLRLFIADWLLPFLFTLTIRIKKEMCNRLQSSVCYIFKHEQYLPDCWWGLIFEMLAWERW